MTSAIYVENSKNSKLSSKSRKVDTTYASIKNTCPASCELRSAGCYGQLSYVGLVNARLEKSANNSTAVQVARIEARAINQSHGGKSIPTGRDLRLHVSGDSRTVTGTRILNKAVGAWKARGGGDCWTYSHAWRQVPRDEWSNVSVLASVDNVTEVEAARKQGYACAIVVPTHPSDKVFKLEGSDVKWIPCPAQTKENVSCASCRLCFNSQRLFDGNYGIAFAAHGIKKNDIKRRLNIIQ